MNQTGSERKVGYDLENLLNSISVLLDHIDYTAGACRMNEMIAAVLPPSVLSNVKDGVSKMKTYHLDRIKDNE